MSIGLRARLGRLKNSDFVRYGALVFMAQNSVNVMNFLYHVLVSRRIGVAAYGSLNALVAGFTVLSAPALILTTVLVKYAAEMRAEGNGALLRALTHRTIASLGIATAAVAAAGMLLAPLAAGYLHIADLAPVRLMLLILALNIFLPVRGLLQGSEDFRSFSFSLTVEALIKVALALVFTGLGYGLTGALAGWAIGTLGSSIYTGLAVWWPQRAAAPDDAIAFDLRRLLRTSANVTVTTLVITSLGFSDVVIVKHFFDPSAAGLYGAVSLAGKMLFFLVNFVPAVLLPRAANLAREGRPTEKILLQAVAVVALLAGVGVVVYARVPALVVGTLAGAAFTPAAPLLVPYGVAVLLLCLVNTLAYYRMGIHRFEFVPPLCAVAVAQLLGIVLFHQTLYTVVSIVIACNAAALATLAFGLRLPQRQRVPAAL